MLSNSHVRAGVIDEGVKRVRTCLDSSDCLVFREPPVLPVVRAADVLNPFVRIVAVRLVDTLHLQVEWHARQFSLGFPLSCFGGFPRPRAVLTASFQSPSIL